jgi:kynurenine formamidase
MILHIDKNTFIDTSKPIDISLPLISGETNVTAWYLGPPEFKPVMENGFVGSVKQGGNVNFRNIYFNPHGHGTHTECLGHITKEVHSINSHLKEYFYKAQLITIEPLRQFNEEYQVWDEVITNEQLMQLCTTPVDALVIRTKPNQSDKLHKCYSDANPPYLDVKCLETIHALGINHLLLDVPSVDRELDGGKLAFHHAFWGVPDALDFSRTITELIYVPDEVEDSMYVLELQVAPFENDASPSRPVLYELTRG